MLDMVQLMSKRRGGRKKAQALIRSQKFIPHINTRKEVK